jgi:hypothetical protein
MTTCAPRLAQLVLLAGILVAGTTTANAQNLYSGDSMTFDDVRYSPNGRYRLQWYQHFNTTLVVYRRLPSGVWEGYYPLFGWYANVVPITPCCPFAQMQEDGNFVIYRGDSTPYDATNTAGNSGAYLNIQDDGNVVLYSASHVPLWSPW